MRSHLVPFSLVLASVAGAQQEAPGAAGQPVIEVAGQSFWSWEAYTHSQLFRDQELRCGTRTLGGSQQFIVPSDCASTTTIKPEYEPSAGPTYRIPVVVHIIQSTAGAGQISDALVQSQIDVLNEDFNALAGTLGQNGTDARIEFYLATLDPGGNPTTGITRSTNDTWFNDGGSYWNTLNWDPNVYLNIYTNTASGALGYVPALPAGGIVGASNDRVVILWSALGRNAPIGAPYNLGRTATHEVGHYLGLYHTFDSGCGTSACYSSGDRICDTGQESGPVFGCPASHSSCGNADPFHNYMDYSDDVCYMEFTPEQSNRMRCTLQNWRVDLPDPATSCPTNAKALSHNAGSNLDVYTASDPIMGGSMSLSVNDPTHTIVILQGFSQPGNTPLAGGLVVLVDNSSSRLFQLRMSSTGSLNLNIPDNMNLCGFTAFTQGVLLGGGQPFSLTNAIDLTPGR